MTSVELDLEQTRIHIETDQETRRQTLVLSDGNHQARIVIPEASDHHPFPYMLVSKLGRQIQDGAVEVRTEDLRYVAIQHGPHTGPGAW